MDYQRIYNNLINRARNRILEGYSERHHIIPKCIGGSDQKSNIVSLTPEEHYIAHLLLVKMYEFCPEYEKLLFAAHKMTSKSPFQKRSANKLYGWLRKRAIQAIKNLHTGRKRTEKTRLKMSKAARGRRKSEEHKKNLSKANLGKSYEQIMGYEKAQIAKKKQSEVRKGRLKSEQTKLRMKQAWIRRKLRISNV